MKVLERQVQKVKRGKVSAYFEWEKHWAEIESRVGGFPTKRYYQVISGGDDLTNVVWERDWDSLAAAEAAYEKSLADPRASELMGESILEDERRELYMPFTF